MRLLIFYYIYRREGNGWDNSILLIKIMWARRHAHISPQRILLSSQRLWIFLSTSSQLRFHSKQVSYGPCLISLTCLSYNRWCVASHMENNCLHGPLQSTYWAYHSPKTALIKGLGHLDTNNAMFLILLDLSASFDTVKHDAWLNRLNRTVRISDPALKWFTSYLEDRSVKVCVDGQYSS